LFRLKLLRHTSNLPEIDLESIKAPGIELGTHLKGEHMADVHYPTLTTNNTNPFGSLTTTFGGYQLGVSTSTLGTFTAVTIPKEPTMRCIWYRVINPDPKLVDVAPDKALLLSDTIMTKHASDDPVRLEIGSKIAQALAAYNEGLVKLTWENEKGTEINFKPKKIGDFDVIIGLLKNYP
jgi:hypothetical protein